MRTVSAPSKEEADAALMAEIEAAAAIAFTCDCRLAACVVSQTHDARGHRYDWDFVVLSPGESPKNRGWTIYENHGGRAVGRLA